MPRWFAHVTPRLARAGALRAALRTAVHSEPNPKRQAQRNAKQNAKRRAQLDAAPYRALRSSGLHMGLWLALCTASSAAVLLPALARAAPAASDSYVGRPIYSEPASGLQLPPGCEVDPSWRTTIVGTELDLWIATCAGVPRVWLLRRQVIEVVNARQSRLRFEVLDERQYPDETAGETLSVQCTGPSDEPGYVVRGARWRPDSKDLRLRSAKGVLRADARSQRLVDTEIGAVDCVRFPDREAMMKRLQQRN